LDVWVWGSGYRYSIAMLIRDANGSVHEMPLGRLSHIGWKNMLVKIPTTMVQRSYLRTGGKNLKFVGFRVKTDANAPVDGAVVYFDNLKYLTDILVNTFDGYELDGIEFGESDSGSAGEAQQ
ncbi:MAG: flagellar filament protein FlaA, partial [Spirochaetaceae bacterium]|nr:flagellar filament protein FlaA [Spirochaetaceae bacterium]